MELVKFRVQNFRSIENSGDIEVSKISALVGRNESGKSNLLLALASLSPKGKRKPLNPVKDFPRSRRLSECKPETQVVWTWWTFTPKETDELAAIVGVKLKTAVVGRGYPALRSQVAALEKQLWYSMYVAGYDMLNPQPGAKALPDIKRWWAVCKAFQEYFPQIKRR